LKHVEDNVIGITYLEKNVLLFGLSPISEYFNGVNYSLIWRANVYCFYTAVACYHLDSPVFVGMQLQAL